MQVVCIQAHGDHVPGDLVDIPDGAGFSELHYALPGAPEALAAEAAATSPTATSGPAPEAPTSSTPVLAPPAGAEGSI